MKKKIEVATLNPDIINITKKRGRKPKTINLEQNNENIIIKESINKELKNEIYNENKIDFKENINVIIEESCLKDNLSQNFSEILNNDNSEENISTLNDINDYSFINDETKPIAKKRGRKPKGGKIIQQIVSSNNNKESKPNVILHLKCSLKDLHTNAIPDTEIQSYNSFNFQSKIPLSYEIINNESFIKNESNNINSNKNVTEEENDYEDEKIGKENDIREVWKKLKVLEHNLHINNICDKKSACFWCTYEFDNPPIYIPKYFIKNSYHVYGCFCSPECAAAHLMEENIESSSKFERYYLINFIYSKIYNYAKNIKPAPNPYYMLEKYYGNLTIQEYRALLRNERLFLIVDKPLTRILPELHEDNDDFIINNKIIPSNNFQIKKKLKKKQLTKTNILSERFGLSQ